MNAVFAVSRSQIADAFASRTAVLHRAAWMVNVTEVNVDVRDERRPGWREAERRRLYGGQCKDHPDWSPPSRPEHGRLLRERRKLEAIGLEMLWHVVWGAPPVLPLQQAPCVKWYLDMEGYGL